MFNMLREFWLVRGIFDVNPYCDTKFKLLPQLLCDNHGNYFIITHHYLVAKMTLLILIPLVALMHVFFLLNVKGSLHYIHVVSLSCKIPSHFTI
jgi:hypothetical protein